MVTSYNVCAITTPFIYLTSFNTNEEERSSDFSDLLFSNGTEQLDSHIFNAITKLRNNKKQPNENSIYNYILKTVESLTTEQLENRLRDLIKANKLENKLYSGRNSYFIVENEENTFPKETSLPSDIILSEKNTHPLTRYTHIRILRTEG